MEAQQNAWRSSYDKLKYKQVRQVSNANSLLLQTDDTLYYCEVMR